MQVNLISAPVGAHEYLDKLVRAAERTEPDYSGALSRLQNEETVRLLHVGMGLVTEAAEFLDMLKKHLFYGKQIDTVNAMEELGDVSWYMRIGCSALRWGLGALMERNVEKLRARFPDKFTEFYAVNRDLASELAVLEKKQ